MVELKLSTTDNLKHAIGVIQEQMDYLTCDIASCNTSLFSSFESLSCRVNLLEEELNETIATLRELQSYIRSVSDVKTENPKRKDDLEIFPRIEWDEDFLKLSDNMFLIDL